MSYRAKFIHTYGHNGHVGVLVELSLLGGSITIRMPEFLELANDVAMHIAASRPANLEALLSQPFVKDTSVTVAGYISKVSR
jgi:translation elongation factor EF-Ts